MSRYPRLLIAGCVSVAALAHGAPMRADIDATGAWSITVCPFACETSIVHFVQTGVSLTTDTGFSGTIDPLTGVFALSAPAGCPGQFNTVSGTVAPDGRTLDGTLVTHDTAPFPFCCLNGCSYPLGGTRCGGGTIDPGEQCDDGNIADGDGCSAQCQIEQCFTCTGEPSVCTPVAGHPCDDGDLCTTNACDASGACVVTGSVNCDDGLGCTVDSCDPLLGCRHAADLRTCRSAQRSTLRVTTDAENRLVWRWRRGQSTSQSEFADPRATAVYTFCLFAGTSAAVAAEADIPPDAAKWAPLASNGFRYTDKSGTADGIRRVVLRGSDTERTNIVVKGMGAALPLTPPPLDLPLTAQLTNGDTNLCWSTTFDAGDVIRNESGRLRAKSATP
jgi:cysteine-rich repeat protein